MNWILFHTVLPADMLTCFPTLSTPSLVLPRWAFLAEETCTETMWIFCSSPWFLLSSKHLSFECKHLTPINIYPGFLITKQYARRALQTQVHTAECDWKFHWRCGLLWPWFYLLQTTHGHNYWSCAGPCAAGPKWKEQSIDYGLSLMEVKRMKQLQPKAYMERSLSSSSCVIVERLC